LAEGLVGTNVQRFLEHHVALVNLVIAIALFGQRMLFSIPWLGYGIEFAIRLDSFSAFILLASAGLGFLVALYSSAFMREKPAGKQFFAYFLRAPPITKAKPARSPNAPTARPRSRFTHLKTP
jgi:formate hydrogenlyase subunit 3/multisubunit Na+/H+ antiporter MnhD subunit